MYTHPFSIPLRASRRNIGSILLVAPINNSYLGLGARMASGHTISFSSLGIKNSNIKEAPGVKMTDKQKVIVGSVLDLFE